MNSELEALRKAGVHGVALSGIGKVNAARTATEMILRDRPDFIINSGCAGSIDRTVGVKDLVIGEQVAYHDVWCGYGNAFGQVDGLPQRFDADPHLLSVAQSLRTDLTVHSGLVITGDQFYISLEEDARQKELYPDALACDMESASIAQVCRHYGVPFLSFRMISDIHTSDEDQKATYEGFWGDLAMDSFEFMRMVVEGV